ncbi:ATP-binding protein [Streptomyces sp. NEAU-S77]|uniref:ATP-binding protein n=1 Tax=Streptomyces sp. NEAU-S77 TaxID=3411033 RepID=UPI003B9DF49E
MKQEEPEREPTPEAEPTPGPTQGLAPGPEPEPEHGGERSAPQPAPILFAEPWEYELHFPRDPRGPAIARIAIKAVLTAHGLGELNDRAELLASELTTNAVRYATGSAAVRPCWTKPVLRVSVTDTCPGLPVPLHPPGPGAEHGRGLLILDLLADAWGGCRLGESPFGAGGKSIWFELVLEDGAPPPGVPLPASGPRTPVAPTLAA